jgi:hypothetical protein
LCDASFGEHHLSGRIAKDEPSLECIFGKVERDPLKYGQSLSERRKQLMIRR